MERTKKNYVEFKPENSYRDSDYYLSREVAARDPKDVSLPDGYVAFRFFSRYVRNFHGKELTGSEFNYSGWYYKGEKLSLEEAKKRISAEEWRKLNLSGCPNVVIASGKAFPLWAIDQVLQK